MLQKLPYIYSFRSVFAWRWVWKRYPVTQAQSHGGPESNICIYRSCDHVYCHSTLVCLSASLKGIQERSQSGKRVCFCPYLRNHGRPHGARILNRCFQRWPPPVLAGLDSRKIGMPGLNCRMVTGASLIAAVVALKDTTRLLLYVNGP